MCAALSVFLTARVERAVSSSGEHPRRAGGRRDVALMVVCAAHVKCLVSAHALVAYEHVGSEVGAGQVSDVQVAIGRRGRRSDEKSAHGSSFILVSDVLIDG